MKYKMFNLLNGVSYNVFKVHIVILVYEFVFQICWHFKKHVI